MRKKDWDVFFFLGAEIFISLGDAEGGNVCE